MGVLEIFKDPVLRAPILGCALMGVFTSLVGVIAFLKKRSLIGETISHGTYPGVILGMSVFALVFPNYERYAFIGVLVGAFFVSFLALKLISVLERRFQVKSDASLCFTLTSFFGLGLLFASHMQFSLTKWYSKAQVYLYGQAATMVDMHVYIYLALTCLLFLFLIGSYHHLKVLLFDPNYAKVVFSNTKWIDRLLTVFFVLSIVVGIRSVGIVLMSGMLIAPVVAARQYTEKLSHLFILTSLISILSAFLGVIVSYQLSLSFALTLPTGPFMIALCCIIAFFSLLFAPKRGYLFRCFRVWSFKKKCQHENVLKSIWKAPLQTLSSAQLQQRLSSSQRSLSCCLSTLMKQGWVEKTNKRYRLTRDGEMKAMRIIRLHRLWELYLAEHLEMEVDKVHRNAEEMEHIITPELEQRLTKRLEDPSVDPHQQSIPKNVGF